MVTRVLTHRLEAERRNIAVRMPQFQFVQRPEGLYVEGWQGTSLSSTLYFLRMFVSPQFPFEHAGLYIAAPLVLWKRDHSGTVNGIGGSHEFHTLANGPGGCVQICHCRPSSWHASRTLLSVLTKGVLWVFFYEAYLRTGKSVAYFFDQWKNRHTS